MASGMTSKNIVVGTASLAGMSIGPLVASWIAKLGHPHFFLGILGDANPKRLGSGQERKQSFVCKKRSAIVRFPCWRKGLFRLGLHALL